MNEIKEKLVWQDDFDGPLNRDIWQFEEGYKRNNELQYYTDSEENVYTEDSCLCIRATKSEQGDIKYFSGSVNTYKTKSFLYGKLEMRAKLPFGNGIWPAFWTVGDDKEINPWPACGEIDIMEMIGGRGGTWTTLGNNEIWCSLHSTNQKTGYYCGPFNPNNNIPLWKDFHTYGIRWTKDEIIWYFDDIELRRADISDNPCFQKPHYLLLNLAVGGNWAKDPTDSTIFPQTYYIDWVRYYTFDE